MTDDRAQTRLDRLQQCPVAGCEGARKLRGPHDRASFQCGAVFGAVNGRIVAVARCRTSTELAARLLNLECGVSS